MRAVSNILLTQFLQWRSFYCLLQFDIQDLIFLLQFSHFVFVLPVFLKCSVLSLKFNPFPIFSQEKSILQPHFLNYLANQININTITTISYQTKPIHFPQRQPIKRNKFMLLNKRTILICMAILIFEDFVGILIYIIYERDQRMSSTKKRIGKYIIFLNEKLGFGAFSEVFKGVEEDTKEEVAIKVVAKSKIQEDEYTKNAFYSEIQIMKRLKSTNIIKFLDVHETKNNFYIILELAQGGTLRTNLRKIGRIDEKSTMKCLIQILNGFGQLVKNGVIHRDLKPENILLRDDVLKIADFGFAKHSENNSFLRTIVGTPAYMAPQILNQEKYTYKCDIWSLGVITYQMMVGKIPWIFTEKSLQAIKKEILTRRITFPEDVAMSSHMKDFILGCLCIDESKRFDWEQIFLHPLFGSRFQPNFKNKKEGSTKISFIMANLRMNLHSKNINLNKILSKLGEKLTKIDFFNLMRYIYKQITQEDLIVFFNYISHKDDCVYVQDFKTFLMKHECRMTGIDLTKMEIEEGSGVKGGLFLMARLKTCIDRDNIDINKLFRDQGVDMNAEVDLAFFAHFINLIDPSMSHEDIQNLYKDFDANSDGIVLFSQIYKGICKIAQIVPIEAE